jgi:hypothetical protein
MTPRIETRLLMIGVLIAFFYKLGVAQESPDSGALPLNSIIGAVEKTQSGVQPQLPYQVIREYRLFGAHSSSADSDVVAVVNVRPPSSKDYRIQKTSGSSRGQQVVRRVLDNEVEATSNYNQARSALTRDNYDFSYLGKVLLDSNLCYLLELKPKRKESDLISGQAWVDSHTFSVRQIEGEIAKTPSWWLKRVHVKIEFADVEGTWLQTGMEAVADVRMVGPHTLISRVLDYRGTDVVASTKIASTHNTSNAKP